MIIQPASDEVRIAYVSDVSADWMRAAASSGLVDPDGRLYSYVAVSPGTVRNAYGVGVKSMRLGGKTMATFVVGDTVKASALTSEAIAEALNAFGFGAGCSLSICGKLFTGPFAASSPTCIMDSKYRSIGFSHRVVTDIRQIEQYLAHIGDDGGKMLEPLTARFVQVGSEIRHSGRPLVGYANLEDYLFVIESPLGKRFFKSRRGTYGVFVRIGKSGHISVSAKSVSGERVVVEMSGYDDAFDPEKNTEYEPTLIFSFSPLKIKDARFPWTKVKFGKTYVFITSLLVNDPGLLPSLDGGINLIADPGN